MSIGVSLCQPSRRSVQIEDTSSPFRRTFRSRSYRSKITTMPWRRKKQGKSLKMYFVVKFTSVYHLLEKAVIWSRCRLKIGACGRPMCPICVRRILAAMGTNPGHVGPIVSPPSLRRLHEPSFLVEVTSGHETVHLLREPRLACRVQTIFYVTLLSRSRDGCWKE
jgi:hypothetical protein